MPNEITEWLFNPSGLTPHGFCLLWNPGLIWTYAISDASIGIAYFTIPLALAVIAQRRRDLVFRPLFLLFAAFILLCGASHWLDVLTLWFPAYGFEALVKAATAMVSIFTAIMLWRLLPQAISLPSPAQLQQANDAIRQRDARLHQSSKMEAVGQLTGGIAHDFNNTLQGITGALELLEYRISQQRLDDLPRYSAAIRKSLTRASNLTHRLMAFSRQQTLQPAAVSPDALAQGMAELIQRTLGPEISLELRLCRGAWRALCDPNQLESALLNLAINSRDAMPNGGRVTIVTGERHLSSDDLSEDGAANSGDFVEIAVVDTGCGMTRETQSRAFDPFFTTKQSGEGTGLGLSQVYGFVAQSGGLVRLESELGRGTTVHLFLPRTERASDETVESASSIPSSKSSAPNLASASVLVVDDEEAIRGAIVEMLSDLEMKVFVAGDGPAALQILHGNPTIALLVTDIGLPGMNGRALADKARTIRPDLPIILITGYAGSAASDMSLEAGMAILQKPFTLESLALRVRSALGGEHAR